MAAYHFQQAAEKYLKAFLVFHQFGVKKTHNIGTLTLLAGNIDAKFIQLVTVADVDAITQYATFFRYPNEEEIDFPAPADLQEAKRFCEATKKLVVEQLTDAPQGADRGGDTSDQPR
jgi:HEPN domain-containing protein